MDMRYEAAPMEATADVVEAVIKVVIKVVHKAIAPIVRVASFSCPSIAGTSISAVSPDYTFIGGTAKAA